MVVLIKVQLYDVEWRFWCSSPFNMICVYMKAAWNDNKSFVFWLAMIQHWIQFIINAFFFFLWEHIACWVIDTNFSIFYGHCCIVLFQFFSLVKYVEWLFFCPKIFRNAGKNYFKMQLLLLLGYFHKVFALLIEWPI